MPYAIFEHDGNEPYCVYKHDADGQPVGDTLGCHATRPQAEAQMAALYAAEGKAAKAGARHSAKDRELLHGIRQKAREIDQAAVDLGDQDEETPPEAPQKANTGDATQTPLIWGMVKAAGDWQLDVLGVPFGSPASKDSDGQFFDAQTALHDDKFPSPPVVYYHGYGPDRRPLGTPEYIGRTVKRWRDASGEWFRVVLDKTSGLARRVWEAAQKGVARASSGSIANLVRFDEGGHIREWPVVELSVFDAVDGRQPANRYAVAIPTAKAIYERAGLEFTAPEAEPGPSSAATAAQTASAVDKQAIKTSTEDKDMDAQDMQKAIAESVAAAMKAEREANEAKVKSEAAEKEKIDAAIKAERAKWEAEQAPANRLPGGMPHVRKYSIKYDNMTPAEHALVIEILSSRGGAAKKQAPSDEMVRALALKVESESGKDAHANEAAQAIKAMGLKANEIMYSTLASHGDEWVGVLYSNRIWDAIRADCWVWDKMQPYTDTIPDGYESDIVPLESTDPTWYKVSQATDHSSSRPSVTVTASQLTTAQKQITLAKMGCRVDFAGELTEDSLVPVAPQIVRQMQASGAEQLEHVLIDGDTETSSSTNINAIGGAMSATATYALMDGFRKLALVTNTANSRAGGALEDADYLETVMLLGTGGINADVTKVGFIVDVNTYWKTLQLAVVKTRDVFGGATLESGRLTGIWGYPLRASAFMHYLSTVRKANTAGKVDQTNTANNVAGAILAVRWDQWRIKMKRRMTIETDRWPESDTNMIVAMMRFGLGYRDTDASAITYGVGL